MIQWTSLEAYDSIYPDLPRRRQQALRLLLEYVNANQRAPTGQELESYGRSLGRSSPTQPNHFKRLSELADLVNAVHRTAARRCSVTGMLALTWTPGPIPGTELGETQIDMAIVRRLGRLRKYVPLVLFDDARFILGCVESKLEAAWTVKG